MSLTPLTFTGISTYSSDFQAVIDRAVAIATVPLHSLQNQQTDLLQEKMLVGNLSTAVGSLASSLQRLASVSAAKALAATSSDASKVKATNIGSTVTATYTISDISSLATVASESSAVAYPNSSLTPIASTPATVKLVVGDTSKSLDIGGNNTLAGLRDAINASGLEVSATILTVSPTENYLSVSANAAGATTLKLIDDPDGTSPVNLLTSLNQGADTVFKLNGAPVSTNSTQISNIIPGVSLSILDTTGAGESVVVALNSDRSAISDALQNFISAYNSLVDQVDAQVGENAGLLSGDHLVRLVQDDMRQLAGYRGEGSIRGLSELGVEFDSTGKASFNQDTFDSLPNASMSDVFTFLGSKTTGFAGMASLLLEISDPLSGLAKLQLDQYDQSDHRLTDQISITTDQITNMQETLSAKLIAADALLGQLESQQKIIDASIQSLELVLFGKSAQSQ